MLQTEEKKPLVSIVIPCLNSGEAIERTIKSVISQSYDNIELIIIDGGSTDNTVDIIKKYKDNIDYWVSEKDKSASQAFSKGIKQSRGELVGTMNANDWYEPEAVETVVNFYNTKDADFYIGATRHWQDESRAFIATPDIDYRKKVRYRMPRVNLESGFIKKSAYDEVGLWNEELICTGDHELLLRLVENGKQGFLFNKVIANHTSGGITDVNAPLAYKEVMRSCPDKFKAFIWAMYSAVKFYTRRTIKVIPGGDRALHFVRKIKYR